VFVRNITVVKKTSCPRRTQGTAPEVVTTAVKEADYKENLYYKNRCCSKDLFMSEL
jgi:hypothetical protein